MSSGNVTLLEAAKGAPTPLKMGIIETIIQESPIIGQLPWRPFEGTALQHYEESTLPDVQFRDINETYSQSFGTDLSHYWGVAILGGEVKVDNYLVDVMGTRPQIKAKQYAKLAKSNAMRFDFEAINGTGASKGFKGVKQLISEGFGQSLANVATAGGTLSLDKMDEANDLFRNQGGADTIWINRTLRRKVTSKARNTVTGVALIDVGTDAFGKQVVKWNGIPLTILGDCRDASGNTVATLPFTEDPGDAVTDCSSIYFVRLGEDDVTGLLGKGGSFDVRDFGETQAGPQHLGRLEWYPGLAIFNRYSIVRLSSIDQT